MKNSVLKEAIEHYQHLKAQVRQQEEECNDIESFCGVDTELFEQFMFAKSELQGLINPDDYFALKDKVSHLNNEIGALILENMLLKNEVCRLGGNPYFLGNVDSEGNS